ncbi:Pancreatic lipase-related protein 2 [Gryllus bimaculatus]|nr:Pancreatic lipase-related protein 2 [Gryllus bimaculatus]
MSWMWERLAICGARCCSVAAALAAPCDLQRCSQMGLRADQFPAQGSFYVQTNEAAPYCRSQPDVDEQMGRLLAASNVALSP